MADLTEKTIKAARVVCKCKRGYGSEYDGLCYHCRGCTAYEAKRKAMSPAARAFAQADALFPESTNPDHPDYVAAQASRDVWLADHA